MEPEASRRKDAHSCGVEVFRDLDEVKGFDPTNTVVHVCTPPGNRVSVLEKIAALGFKKALVEKPLVTSLHELEVIKRLHSVLSINLLVVNTWLWSTLTARLEGLIMSGQHGDLQQISVEQHKPRVLRTLSDAGHHTAFDVEMPHQVALALHLAGTTDVRVVDSAVSDLCVGPRVVPNMGTASLRMMHANRSESTMFSDLTATARERRIILRLNGARVEGHYPVNASCSISRLAIYGTDDRLICAELLNDDPLTNCFLQTYRYFSGKNNRSPSDLRFNSVVVEAISEAKNRCGLASRSDGERSWRGAPSQASGA